MVVEDLLEPVSVSKIHPTAIIGADVCLDDDVEVGPYCHLEGAVKVGAGTRLMGNVRLQGPLSLGNRNNLYPYVCLGLDPQSRQAASDSPGPGVVIGDDNIFRESMTIHRAVGDTPTTVGHENYFMVNTHLGHDVILGNGCTLANGALVGGHVEIQDRVTLGGNACVHQCCRIGRLAMISTGMVITRDLPPFCVVYQSRYVSSLNIIGLRRAGYRDSIPALKRAFDILYRSAHSNGKAVEVIESELAGDPLCMELAHFVRHTERGVCTYAG